MSSDISKSSILGRLSRQENEDKFVEKDVERCLDDLWREREIYRKEQSLDVLSRGGAQKLFPVNPSRCGHTGWPKAPCGCMISALSKVD